MRRHLVEFLRRHDALVVKAFHAGIRFLGDYNASFRFLPHFVGAANLFLSCALFSLPALCRSGGLGGFRLREFGFHIWRFEEGEGVAHVNHLSFLHFNFKNTSRHLARNAIFRNVGLSLDGLIGLAERIHTGNGHHHNNGSNDKQGRK